MRRGAAIVTVLTLLAGAGAKVDAAELTPVAFSDLAGWDSDDHVSAFRVWMKSCAMIDAAAPALRPGVPAGDTLAAVCAKGMALNPRSDGAAKAFFEKSFQPFRIGQGMLTGYYEPESFGSLTPTKRFDTPLLARPPDLVSMLLGETLPGIPANIQAARRKGDGYEPYPTRSQIDDGVLGELAKPIVWLERVDAFFIHIQGSSRVKLPDGRMIRIAYDGRNGRPFTGIGRLLVEKGEMTKEVATMAQIRAWLAKNPEEGRTLMRKNDSYIFFKIDEVLRPEDGPRGAQDVALTPGRSLAVDRALWPYGLPIWLDGRFPDGKRIRRLMIAQDTGSAIKGVARGDYFAGTGDAAGEIAGGMRQQTDFVVLLPRPDQRP
ncbi:MltA domain-containing protein [Methylopila sp. M107]|uniref:murein transglycosylase A n=1 Tax=Methylopila sp. M107 TaxID=1101190 RepID=UPI000360BB2F|nr:MltA domain-containing protein [Methylopila sp. M107]